MDTLDLNPLNMSLDHVFFLNGFKNQFIRHFFIKPEREALDRRPSASRKGIHRERYNLFFGRHFFWKQMVIAQSVFT